mgnify:CR=1 FL=1
MVSIDIDPVATEFTQSWVDRAGLGDHVKFCLLYTSDAADDLLCVDLGGRRIIKKKKTEFHTYQEYTDMSD